MDRYHQTDVMSPAPGNGSWVLWADHCASLADAQAEIARLRGALESASNYIDNLGGVSKTFRSYLNS